MTQTNNQPLHGQGSVGGNARSLLFKRLDALDAQVNKFLDDPEVRRMVLQVGIVMLAKKYPALSLLLGAFGDTGTKQAQPRAAKNKPPVTVKRRGIGSQTNP